MATAENIARTNYQNLRASEERLGLQRERLRVRAAELKRQQLVLNNELGSPGISEAERDYLQQRIQTLSNDEDALGPKLSRTEQDFRDVDNQILQLQQEQLVTEQRRQLLLRSRAERQTGAGLSSADAVRQTRLLQQSARLYERRRREREQTYTRLAKQAKKAFFLVVVFAVWLAVVADILSIVDAGWVVSWALPIVTWFIVRRITSINRSVQNIVTAQQQALGELRVLRQQLRPALAASGQAGLFASAETLEIRQKVSSYVRTFVRDQIISQVLELIPIIDWLPMYLGEVVKVLIDQRRAYRKAREVLVPYRQTLDLVNRLEDFAVQFRLRQLGISGGPAVARPTAAAQPQSPQNSAPANTGLTLQPA